MWDICKFNLLPGANTILHLPLISPLTPSTLCQPLNPLKFPQYSAAQAKINLIFSLTLGFLTTSSPTQAQGLGAMDPKVMTHFSDALPEQLS